MPKTVENLRIADIQGTDFKIISLADLCDRFLAKGTADGVIPLEEDTKQPAVIQWEKRADLDGVKSWVGKSKVQEYVISCHAEDIHSICVGRVTVKHVTSKGRRYFTTKRGAMAWCEEYDIELQKKPDSGSKT